MEKVQSCTQRVQGSSDRFIELAIRFQQQSSGSLPPRGEGWGGGNSSTYQRASNLLCHIFKIVIHGLIPKPENMKSARHQPLNSPGVIHLCRRA